MQLQVVCIGSGGGFGLNKCRINIIMCRRVGVLCIVSVVILMNDVVIGTVSLCGRVSVGEPGLLHRRGCK
jgi:hypothetical protein